MDVVDEVGFSSEEKALAEELDLLLEEVPAPADGDAAAPQDPVDEAPGDSDAAAPAGQPAAEQDLAAAEAAAMEAAGMDAAGDAAGDAGMLAAGDAPAAAEAPAEIRVASCDAAGYGAPSQQTQSTTAHFSRACRPLKLPRALPSRRSLACSALV